MFKSVLKTSCEIIEFGWSKDRSPRDTFITELATSICERNDYEEEEDRMSETGNEAEIRESTLPILWNSSCLDSLLFSVHYDPPSAFINDPAWVATVWSLYERIVREWIIISLSYAPCTSQGLLQEKLCKANNRQRVPPTTDAVKRGIIQDKTKDFY
ncbi:unnamed protein product [Ilex paraguariensis]|uniref:PI4-kinase N-terminal domain-containing protein n=1 Tax=Ilex paraguariensis TaxID=185542 RepID=A0ABC8R6P4_9AQUA